MPSYSSPIGVVWHYFEMLRRAVGRCHELQEGRQLRQEVAVAIILAVTTVEAFMNVFFRVLVEESGYRQHKATVLKDLSPPFLSLEKKWKKWPREILGEPMGSASGPGKRFVELKNRRNRLMHFTSSHDTIDLPDNVKIEGLPRTDVLDDLTLDDAVDALNTAEWAIAAVLRAGGVPEDLIPKNLHFWTGRAPTYQGHGPSSSQ